MTYREALLHAIDGWNSNAITDEWLFAKFRVDVIDVMSTTEAFESISETIEILLQEADESTATEILEAIICLARRSDTTEIPRMLIAQKTAIENHFATFGDYAKSKVRELFQHYRL